MTPWKVTEGRLVLKVKAKPNARRAGIDGVHGDSLRISVTAPPENNRANEAIIELLSRSLGIAKSRICLLHGEKSPSKTIAIGGSSIEAVQRKLEDLAIGSDS